MAEFLLSTFYFIIFCFVISKIAFFKEGHIPRLWFISLFGVKVLTSIFLTFLYSKYYTNRDTADIFKYFDDSKIIFDAIKTNPFDYLKMLIGIDNDSTYLNNNYYNHMNNWTRPYTKDLFTDTHIIIRFNAFVHLFSFGYIHVHNVFINFISLIGLTIIYKAFKQFTIKKERALFYLIMLVPSILFWGSGLLKEGIIFFALGIFLINLFKLKNEFKLKYLFYILIGAGIIVFTKFYLIIAFSIPVFGYLLNHIFHFKKSMIGYLFSIAFFIIAINISPFFIEQLDFVNQIVNKQHDFSRFVMVEGATSGFLIPELSDGFSLIKNIPNALLNTLVRPYLWECNALFVWLSALENITVLTFIIAAIVFRKKMNKAQKNIFYFNLIFVFCLFTLIGLTTPVFGAIMRYKIPGLILLLISILMVIDLQKIKHKYPILKKIL
ncbi:MAG: hypothetical protein P8Q14_00520 [Vicingaceae bacterium]|nr:hypothetical protein [Vicingaceae bacterium]